MNKKILALLFCMMLGVVTPAFAIEESQNKVFYNDEAIEFKNPPLSDKGCMIVPVREFSEFAGFEVNWKADEQKVTLFNDVMSVTLYIGDTQIRVLNTVGEDKDVESILPPAIINSVTYVPLRTVAEAFGAEVIWDGDIKTVYICPKFDEEEREAEPEQQEEVSEERKHTFYSQYDPEYINLYKDEPYRWTESRNGYCYVTAYAMLISDVTGEVVTPIQVADVNLAKCGNASICYHWEITEAFGVRLVSALSEESEYFKEYDRNKCLTMIDNSTPEAVEAAIKEALDAHPEGVLVRDTTMPHTMVAIGYDDEGIFFNDPALKKSEVRWEETCLKKKDMTTIVAIAALEKR